MSATANILPPANSMDGIGIAAPVVISPGELAGRGSSFLDAHPRSG
jgi:hypothetical protein